MTSKVYLPPEAQNFSRFCRFSQNSFSNPYIGSRLPFSFFMGQAISLPTASGLTAFKADVDVDVSIGRINGKVGI
jgi:hypothetical protein